MPRDEINQIKYFTARVQARPNDPDQPVRQQTYFRALKTIPNVSIIEGMFLTHPVQMHLYEPNQGGRKNPVWVLKTEEKGSDVNIATHLLNDGYKGDYEVAVVITNDSDLVEPVKLIRQELALPVIILNPDPVNHPSRQLKLFATAVKPIRAGVLRASQFPETLTDQDGTFHKPGSWQYIIHLCSQGQ